MSDAHRVLVVVENDPDMRRLIRVELMDDPRIEVSGEAATVEAAIGLLAGREPALVILDNYLDDDTRGIDAAPALKEAAPHARILLLTADDLSAEARREPAIDAYLRKTDIERLLPTARKLLGLEGEG